MGYRLLFHRIAIPRDGLTDDDIVPLCWEKNKSELNKQTASFVAKDAAVDIGGGIKGKTPSIIWKLEKGHLIISEMENFRERTPATWMVLEVQLPSEPTPTTLSTEIANVCEQIMMRKWSRKASCKNLVRLPISLGFDTRGSGKRIIQLYIYRVNKGWKNYQLVFRQAKCCR